PNSEDIGIADCRRAYDKSHSGFAYVSMAAAISPWVAFRKGGENMNRGRLYVAATLVTVSAVASVVLSAASDPMVVRLRDKCDPTTFNAALGAGTCAGDGNITFNHFISEVTSAKKAGAWHFDPAAGTLDEGTVLALENRGGETHTFTKVENFGGG